MTLWMMEPEKGASKHRELDHLADDCDHDA